MDILWDLITFPFELIGGSIECLFSCFFIAMVGCCILSAMLFLVN